MHDSGSRVQLISCMIPYVSEKNNNRSEGNTDDTDTVTSEQAESVRTNAQGLWT